MYSVLQQCAVVFVAVLGVDVARMVVQSVAREGGYTWLVLLPAIASTLVWPLVAVALNGVRRQFRVE
jgi:cell shape-determining protein MreD